MLNEMKSAFGGNIKKILASSAVSALMLGASMVPAFGAGGFDQYGYNDTARNFVGTGSSWCQGKIGWDKPTCDAYMGAYANDKLVMKWNADWDRGNAEGWTDPEGYKAWTDNEWNGKKDGSGEVWHYKIKWVGACGADGAPLPDGGYCIWGQFEVLMDQGTSGGVHTWLTRSTPNGYGGN